MATTRTPGSGGRMAIAPSARRLRRFSRTERALHWVHASAFFVLFGSGLCLYLPSLAQLVGRRPLLKDIQIFTALARGVAAGPPCWARVAARAPPPPPPGHRTHSPFFLYGRPRLAVPPRPPA